MEKRFRIIDVYMDFSKTFDIVLVGVSHQKHKV
jgi:hypothetical protein